MAISKSKPSKVDKYPFTGFFTDLGQCDQYGHWETSLIDEINAILEGQDICLSVEQNSGIETRLGSRIKQLKKTRIKDMSVWPDPESDKYLMTIVTMMNGFRNGCNSCINGKKDGGCKLDDREVGQPEDEKESEPTTRDITQDFLSLDNIEFSRLLDQLVKEKVPSLTVRIEWDDETMDINMTYRLKAFTESYKLEQERIAIIVSTREQRNVGELSKAGNAFGSGVKWEEIK